MVNPFCVSLLTLILTNFHICCSVSQSDNNYQYLTDGSFVSLEYINVEMMARLRLLLTDKDDFVSKEDQDIYAEKAKSFRNEVVYSIIFNPKTPLYWQEVHDMTDDVLEVNVNDSNGKY